VLGITIDYTGEVRGKKACDKRHGDDDDDDDDDDEMSIIFLFLNHQ
jgi:hypothetical protein